MRSLLAQSSAGNQPATPTRSPATTAPSSPASKENQRSAIAPQGKGNAVVAPPKVLAAAAAASPAVVGPTLPAGDEEDNPRSWRSWKTGELLTPWETQVLNKPDVKRKANVAQLYFLNYYFDSLRYLSQRKARASEFEQSLQQARDEAGPAWSQTEEAREVASYNGRERALLRKRRTKLRLAQFHIITQVGQGGYGEVFLARKKETGEVCALKKLKKKVLVKTDEAHHVLVERDILTATRTPWLVKLLYAFQDPEYVYLAMEYVPGGDFRTLLNKSGVLREQHARFYAAEMFVAVNELHKLGYLHRDLKPENFLIDATGHIKLTDFGLASGALNPGRIASLRDRLDKVKDTDFVYRTPLERRSLYQANSRQYQVEAAKSIVGSPDYMAPEVLRAKSTATYGVGADYWSLGCILYEFLCGFPPFTGRSPDETWANLKNWKRVLQRPVYTKAEDLQFNLTDIAWDAVTRLIEAPELRYQSLSEVSGHAFFKPLAFHSLRERSPPYVPQLESEVDTAHFDDFDNPEDMAKYKEVKDKQQRVEAVQERGTSANRRFDRGLWVGFTFGKNGQLGAQARTAASSTAGSDMPAQDAFATMF